MSDYKIFSERLKEAMRKNNRMKQLELAEEAGMTEVTISRYVNGHRVPTGPTIAKFAEILNVSSDYLIGIDEDMNANELGTINLKSALEYCEKAADGWSDFCKKALDNIGHGDSYSSSFGAVAFGNAKEEMYRYEIPSVLKYLSSEKE